MKKRWISRSSERFAQGHITVEEVEPEDWHAGWRKYFKPIYVGEVLCVRPPWEKAAVSSIEKEIVIEPKQAFGTGNHATTMLMLQAIVQNRAKLPARALDIGTGSAILAIAHALFNENANVTGFDIDPVAIENAEENASANGVARQLHLFTGNLGDVKDGPYPLIYANLQKHIILPMLDDLRILLEPTGKIIFSGILETETASMRKVLERHNFRVNAIEVLDEWISVVCERGDA